MWSSQPLAGWLQHQRCAKGFMGCCVAEQQNCWPASSITAASCCKKQDHLKVSSLGLQGGSRSTIVLYITSWHYVVLAQKHRHVPGCAYHVHSLCCALWAGVSGCSCSLARVLGSGRHCQEGMQACSTCKWLLLGCSRVLRGTHACLDRSVSNCGNQWHMASQRESAFVVSVVPESVLPWPPVRSLCLHRQVHQGRGTTCS
jgi:hypothetical protein